MAMEKVSITMDSDTLRRVRARVGQRGVSAFIDESVRLRLQHERIRKLLRELDEKYGPIPDDVRAEFRKEWDASRPQPPKKRRRRS